MNFKKLAAKAMIALTAFCFAETASAKVIEHIADRYIINVDQMELNGEESLMDILMMVPDVVSIDAKTTNTDELGTWAVRIDNVQIGMNAKVFLQNTKAREVKKIKICINPGIMKGCGGLKTVIDINYRKKENGVSGKVALEGDTYGNAELFANATIDRDNLTFRTFVQGELARSKQYGVRENGQEEDVKVHLNWDITGKDNLELFASQNFSREKSTLDPAMFTRYYHFEGVYTRDLGPHGAYALVQGAGDYKNRSTIGFRYEETNPYILFEFGFPFISKNLYMTTGIETGFSASTDQINDFTDRSRYEDGYIQLDWNVGKFNFSIGDRFRIENYWFLKPKYAEKFEKTFTNNHFTATAWYNFNDNHTLQATFARRFLSSVQDIDELECQVKDVYKKPAYISEMRYTFQQKNYNIMGIIKNTRQELDELIPAPGSATGNVLAKGHDNTLMLGVSSFMHFGVLRMTAGVNYFHSRTNFEGEIDHDNYVNLKLAPQVSVDGWRFTSTMLYSTKKATFLRPANFYADLGISKEFNEHWLVEGKFHDIAGQKYGNRAFSLGATYSF